MARRSREEQAGGIHHAFARGVERRTIFLDEVDFKQYVKLVGQVTVRYRWNLLAYCLMPNHVHLLVETPEPNLGRGMQHLHGLYAAGFNERHGRIGHLFERRYGNVPIRNDAQLLTATTYIALNPVKAALATRPENWPWSSHAATVNDAPPPWLAVDRLSELFSTWGGEPFAAYAAAIDRRLGV
jgi:REP element-mobilizing transposase RayT